MTSSADFGSDITAAPRALVPVVAGPDAPRPRLVHGAVTAVERVGDRYWVLRVAAPHIAHTSLPGQFVMISIAAADEPVIILPRPIAVYGVDRDAGTIDLCIGVVGAGTRRLASLTPGVVTTVVGPLGRSFPLSHVTRHLLLVGRGIGVCSLTELSRAATERQISVTAVVSGRHGGALVGVDRLDGHGAHVMTVTDADGTSDPDELRASLLARRGDQPSRHDRDVRVGSAPRALHRPRQRMGRDPVHLSRGAHGVRPRLLPRLRLSGERHRPRRLARVHRRAGVRGRPPPGCAAW